MVDQATWCGDDDFHTISDINRLEEKMSRGISVAVVWWRDTLMHTCYESMRWIRVDQSHLCRNRLWNGRRNGRQDGIDFSPSPSITSTLSPSLPLFLSSSLSSTHVITSPHVSYLWILRHSSVDDCVLNITWRTVFVALLLDLQGKFSRRGQYKDNGAVPRL